MMNWTLAQKKILVTGGTKGIGSAIVHAFVQLGAAVWFVARNPQDVTALENNFRLDGKPVWGTTADLASGPARTELIQAIEKKWGKLDVLVNNVGTNVRKTFTAYTQDEYRQLFETNLFSVTEMCRLAFPLLQKGDHPSVINMASVAGSVDVQSGAPYGMTKAAMIQLTRHLAAEWAPHGIRVNAVSPWYIETPLTEPVRNNAARMQKILERTPMGRIGQPQEVAAVAAFLAMDVASYVTGQNIAVDGGFLASGL